MRECKTTCPYCGVGCGVIASRSDEGEISVRGDPDHPANFGKLCSKGLALAETLSLDDRLLFPEIAGTRTSWPVAIDHVATRFKETIAQHGPNSVAFYVSGQLLTEDYYVANKLMKGFIGSGNIDTNSRLCMASSVAGHRRAFGADVVPGNYEDLDDADLVVLTGSNLAWCHPVLFQRLMVARERRGTRIVVIDPRKTATAEFADLHLGIRPGSDVALFNGLLAYLHAHGKTDPLYIFKHTHGLAQALMAARGLDVAKATGVSQHLLEQFYKLFASTERTLTIWSQGVNQSSAGTDKVNAIINCHLITGRVGKSGSGPFSITGQPNAMGGREVGGLANTLAAHMDMEDPQHRDIVQRFWKSPTIAKSAGLKAVDMFEAVRNGRIRAIWIMATNPVVSMPDANLVRDALRACPLVVVSEAVRNSDTATLAHVLLPAATWGEKQGSVTNSERRISRQRSFLPLPGQARADWKIICDVAKAMGFNGFGFQSTAEIFREHAGLSAFENSGTRAFDIGACSEMEDSDYEELEPFQWPKTKHAASSPRLFADGRFFTPSGRANFIATTFNATAHLNPLVFNTGRIRDQWHTMTRTGKSARLAAHCGEPFVQIHPIDAKVCGITPASLVRIASARADVVLRALVTEAQQPGSVFAPIHWSDMNASKARINALIAPNPDPVSGQPDLKFSCVKVSPFAARWFGYAVTCNSILTPPADYWARVRIPNGFGVELAGEFAPNNWRYFAEALLGGHELATYEDMQSNRFRYAAFNKGVLTGALFIAPGPVGLSRQWLGAQLGQRFSANEALQILAGRSGGVPDCGSIICSCNNVGRNSILSAIDNGAVTLTQIGNITTAGTGCGSCRAELQGMIHGKCLQAAE